MLFIFGHWLCNLLFFKTPRIKYLTGTLRLVCFAGLNIVSAAMKPLAGSVEIQNLMASVVITDPGCTVGALVTGIVQSSSAVIAVIQKLAITTTPEGLPLRLRLQQYHWFW